MNDSRGVDARFCAIDFAMFAIEEHLDNICKIAQMVRLIESQLVAFAAYTPTAYQIIWLS